MQEEPLEVRGEAGGGGAKIKGGGFKNQGGEGGGEGVAVAPTNRGVDPNVGGSPE